MQAPTIQSDAPTTTKTAGPTRIRVVARDQLAHEPEGPTRGYAHIGFDDHPPDAPGHLDFDPVLLFAVGRLLPGEGVPMHRHENIENILVLRRGCVSHADSLGNTQIVDAGDVSLLSAGAGLDHAERVEGQAPVEALVIWLRPDVRDEKPAAHLRRKRPHPPNRWSILASGDARPPEAALPLNADAALLTTHLDEGATIEHILDSGRRAYLLVMDGPALIDDATLHTGDRALIEGPGPIHITAQRAADLYLLDLPSPQ